jgi:hypothetical protein
LSDRAEKNDTRVEHKAVILVKLTS